MTELNVQSVSCFAGRKVAVLGLGRSGHSAALALQAGGSQVLAWDDGKGLHEAPYPLVNLHDADFEDLAALVISPGIPTLHPAPNPIAAKARAAGIPIIADVELLIRENPDARFIGITGTNGKSTCTALTAHIIKSAGLPMAVGGNIGVPVLALPKLAAGGVYVLELSSYQLELMQTPGLNAGLLLNISPDHLERHGGMQGYVAAKRRLVETLLRPDGQAIVALDDEITRSMAQSLGTVTSVSGYSWLEAGICFQNGKVFEEGHQVLDLHNAITLPGNHNGQNAAGAWALCRALGLSAKAIAPHFASFPGLEHRQERVAEHKGLVFINDSKATNADAALHALKAYETIYWIVGGEAKDGGITSLLPHLEKVQKAFLIGEAAAEFQAQLSGTIPTSISQTLEKATAAAAQRCCRSTLQACDQRNCDQTKDQICSRPKRLTEVQPHSSGTQIAQRVGR